MATVDISKYKLPKPITTQAPTAAASPVNLEKYKIATPAAPKKYAAAFGQVQRPKGMPTIEEEKANFQKSKEIVKDTFKSGADKIRAGFEEVNTTKNPLEAIEGGVKIASGAVTSAFSPLAPIFEPISKGINFVADKISNNKKVQKFAMSKAGDTTARVAEDVADVANITGAVAGVQAPSKFGRVRTPEAPIIEKAPTIEVPPKSPSAPKTEVIKTEVPKPTKLATKNPVKMLQEKMSEGNVNEQVRTSVERMKTRGDDINKKYNDFFDQEARYKVDPKEDTAISKVGENIGNAYEKVIDLRRESGRIMSEEIKRIGNQKVDLNDSFQGFEQRLKDEANIIYDKKDGVKSTTRQSALTKDDRALLDGYIKELNELGTNPTIGDIDAFIRRNTRELELYKSKNNFTTSNAERLVNSNLADLRNSFNPTKNPELKSYYEARQRYSDLSDFLEEGQGFLGKKTQSGDYAKDASIAKSSVQSVLNNGKKDWLIRLEDLTGYTAIDDAALALQAMKDAGNVQGRSLLELFSPENKTSIPLSKEGVVNKVLDAAVTGAKRAFVGNAKDQTLRVINKIDPKINSFNKNKVNTLIKQRIDAHKPIKETIDNISKDLAEKNQASVLYADLKGADRILRKAVEDYGGRVSSVNKVGDIARNSIVADSSKHTNIVDAIKSQYQKMKDFRVKKPDPKQSDGYVGYNIKIPMGNGLFGEIQVLSPEMTVAKVKPAKAIELLGKEKFDAIVEKSGVEPGRGHEIYEQIQEAIKNEDAALIEKLKEESKEYYSHFAS